MVADGGQYKAEVDRGDVLVLCPAQQPGVNPARLFDPPGRPTALTGCLHCALIDFEDVHRPKVVGNLSGSAAVAGSLPGSAGIMVGGLVR